MSQQLPQTLQTGRTRSPMDMLVMNIRKVGMAVPQWLMAVLVNMGLAAIPVRPVFVLMMRIVRV